MHFLKFAAKKLKDRAGSHKFKIKLIPDANNIVYTGNEKARNPNFKYQENELEFTTDANGEKIIENGSLFVSPAGGDIFSVSATDEQNNTVQSSGKIQTERIMFYEEMKMAGLTAITPSHSRFKDEYEKHHIAFHDLSVLSVPFMENIGETDEEVFKRKVQTAYANSQGPAKQPYCIAIAYTGHLAVKEVNKKVPAPNVRGGQTALVNVPIIYKTEKQHALWNNIVAG